MVRNSGNFAKKFAEPLPKSPLLIMEWQLGSSKKHQGTPNWHLLFQVFPIVESESKGSYFQRKIEFNYRSEHQSI